MKPVEFVLWLNGAAELVGDQPPTPKPHNPGLLKHILGKATK